MNTCKRCGGTDSHKNGMMNGKQRYRCKGCGFNYTTGFRGKPIELRQQALNLYLEGMGYRAIGRKLEVSNVTVLNWVRAYGLGSRPAGKKVVVEAHAPLEIHATGALTRKDSST